MYTLHPKYHYWKEMFTLTVPMNRSLSIPCLWIMNGDNFIEEKHKNIILLSIYEETPYLTSNNNTHIYVYGLGKSKNQTISLQTA